MTDRDEALLRCLDALSSMVSVIAADLGKDMSEDGASMLMRAYGRWNSAHADLMRAMGGEGMTATSEAAGTPARLPGGPHRPGRVAQGSGSSSS
jgi:hypothetical protein